MCQTLEKMAKSRLQSAVLLAHPAYEIIVYLSKDTPQFLETSKFNNM